MGTRITVFAAAAALFAHSDTNLRGRPPDPSILMDARQIIGPFVAATERNWQAQDRYTYVERDEDRRLARTGG